MQNLEVVVSKQHFLDTMKKRNNCQPPVLGIGLGVHFTFVNKNKTKMKNRDTHLSWTKKNLIFSIYFPTKLDFDYEYQVLL